MELFIIALRMNFLDLHNVESLHLVHIQLFMPIAKKLHPVILYLTPRVTAPIYCPFIMPSETFTLMLYCSPHCAVNCTAVSHYIQWCNPAIIVKTHCLLLGLHDTSPPLFSSVSPPRKSPMMHSPSFACVSLRPLCFLAFPCLMHVINQLVSGVLIIVQPRKISTKKKKRPSKQCGIGIVAESNSV